jgi:hypothetical protein
MKRVFQCFQRHTVEGKVFTDADGCVYQKPHPHPVLAGKEFASPSEISVAINDYKNQTPVKDQVPFGEIIVHEIIEA